MTAISNLPQLCEGLRAEGILQTPVVLAICQRVADFTDTLGAAFGAVKKDILKNVAVLEAKYDTDQAKYAALYFMVEEDARQAGSGDGTCACSLLWLKRSTEFVVGILANLTAHPEKTLTACAQEAYEKNLQPFHSRTVQWMVYGAVKWLPTREAWEKSVRDADTEDVFPVVKAFVDTFAPVLADIHGWLCDHKLNSTARV